MSDVAAIGLAVDTTQVKAARADLDMFSAASKTATDAADRLAQASQNAATSTGAIAAAARRAGISIAEYQARAAAFNATTEKMNTASSTATGALTKLNTAAAAAGSGSAAGGLVRMLGSYNAVSLALQGITAVSSAYYALTASSSPTLETALSEQARLVGAVKDAYRDAAEKAGKFYDQSKAVLELQSQQNIATLQSKISDQAAALLKSQVPVSAPTDIMGNISGGSSFDTSNLGPFKSALEELSGNLALGYPAVEKFRNAIADIGNSNPALAGAANALLTASQEAGETADKIKAAERAYRLLQGTATPADREGLGLSNRVRAPARDPFDAAVVSANKHIAAMKADAAAVDATVGEHARLRTEAQLLETAQQRGSVATSAQIAQLRQLGQAAADAAMSLERARVDSAIKFGRDTSLLSSDDVQIASQLRGLYPDVATALGSVEAQALRANGVLHDLGGTLSTTLVTGFADMLDGTKSLSGGFGDMSKAFARAVEEMVIKTAVVAPLLQGLQSMVSGGINLGSMGFNPLAGLTGSLPGAANGGTFGPGWGVVGERGPELINVHSQGVTVIPNNISKPYLPGFADGGMMSRNGGVTRLPFGQDNAPHFSVSVNNYGSDKATVQQKQNSSGGIDWNVMIGNAAATEMGKPGSSLRQVTDQRGRLGSR